MKFIKIKNTPRGGAQPNRLIAKISLFIAFAFFGGVFLLQAEPVYAAQPSAKNNFARTNSGSITNFTHGVIQTKDGGWLTYGLKTKDTNVAPFIMKFNTNGITEWSAFGTPTNAGLQTFVGAAETEDGAFILVSEGGIYKFEKVNGAYQETKNYIIPFSDSNIVIYDGVEKPFFHFSDIIIDDDGGILVLVSFGADSAKKIVIKFADIPTCTLFTPSGISGNYNFNHTCSDIVWEVSVDYAYQGYDLPSFYKEGNQIILDTTTTSTTQALVAIEEATDGNSAQVIWNAELGVKTDGTIVDIASIDNSYWVHTNTSSVYKFEKVENNGAVSLQEAWHYIPPHTNNNVNSIQAGGFALRSDGSVYIKTKLDTDGENTIGATIPSIANHGGGIIIKLDQNGNFTYAIRSFEGHNYQKNGIVVNSDDSFTVIEAMNLRIEKYTDSMIYDINYHIEQAEKPAEYQEFATQQTWANTNFTFAKQSYDGWNFNGWYEDQNLTGTKLNGKYITADTDLYGAYTKRNYTAYFNVARYDDQGNYIENDPTTSQTVTYGSTNYAPEITVPNGYTFTGWYYDFNLTQPADLSDPNSILPSSSTSSMKNFYARLIRSTHLVNFNITSSQNPDYSLETPVRVGHGDTVANPGLSNSQGYRFNGWYTNEGLTNAYNFNTPVTGELNLYGEWVDSTLRIDDEGIHYPGNVIDGTATYDEDTKTLTLDNYHGGPIDITDITDGFTIIINGENIIDSGSGYGIHSSAPLTIEGDGTIDLDVSPSDSPAYGCVLKTDNDLIINSGTININDTRDWGEGAICASGDITINGGDIDIITNTVGIISQKDKGNINLNGGQIDISSKTDGLITYNGLIHLNGSELNFTVRREEGQPCDKSATSTELLKIDKGKLNTDCRIHTSVIVINGGSLNAKNIEAGLFNQNGGKINLFNVGSDFGEDIAAIQAVFVVVNGGEMQIDNNTMGILSIDDYDDDEKARITEKASKIGGVIPENAAVEFNGGDTKINSTLVPIAMLGISPAEDLTTQIYLSNDMLKDPEYATLSQADLMGQYFTAFSDGEGEITLDMSETGITATHAIKTIRIYEKPLPVPATDDDEEVPNTLDFQILGIAGAVFISLMLEGMIIADLYRRLHGYEEEISHYN